MNIFEKMGIAEEVQYLAGRVMHNFKYSVIAVVCAVTGFAILGGFEIINTIFSSLLLIVCICGYIYSLIMINRYEDDEEYYYMY